MWSTKKDQIDSCKTDPKEVDARIKEATGTAVVENVGSIWDVVGNEVGNDSGVVDVFVDVVYAAAKTVFIFMKAQISKQRSFPHNIT